MVNGNECVAEDLDTIRILFEYNSRLSGAQVDLLESFKSRLDGDRALTARQQEVLNSIYDDKITDWR